MLSVLHNLFCCTIYGSGSMDCNWLNLVWIVGCKYCNYYLVSRSFLEEFLEQFPGYLTLFNFRSANLVLIISYLNIDSRSKCRYKIYYLARLYWYKINIDEICGWIRCELRFDLLESIGSNLSHEPEEIFIKRKILPMFCFSFFAWFGYFFSFWIMLRPLIHTVFALVVIVELNIIKLKFL